VSNLVEVGLANAVVAALLAGVALLVERRSRRPALTHALWALVLLKLITPPLFRIPVPGLSHPPEAPSPQASIPRPTAPPAQDEEPHEKPPVPAVPAAFTKLEDLGKPMLPPLAPPTPPPEPKATTSNANAPAAPSPAGPEPEPPTPARPASFLGWWEALALAWGAGACFWLALAFWRAVSFHRLLRYATPAPEGLLDEVRMMAAHLGLGAPPSVWIIPGRLPPLVWSMGRPMLLLPAGLLERLEAPGRSALILHELAHIARRDHWLRWGELLASCLFWWYPIAWLARWRLRTAEEEACDAWVTTELPGYGAAYAGALLDTVDFLSEKPDPIPPAASTFGGLHRLKQRLLTIIQSPAPRTVSPAGWALVLALAALLPLTPVRGAAPPPPAVDEERQEEGPRGREERQAAPPERRPARTAPRDPPTYRGDPRTFTGVTGGQVWSVALSPDEKLLAVATGGTEEEGAVVLFNYPRMDELACEVEARPVRCVAYSPDGKLLIAGSLNGTVQIRDPRTGKVRQPLKGHTGAVTAVAVLPGGRQAVSASLDGTLKVWDLKTGKQARSIQAHEGGAHSLAVASDGKTALSGGKDGTGKLWDLASGKRLHELGGHDGPVEGVALTSDGQMAATCGHDGHVRLWSVPTGKLARALTGHTGPVHAAAFTKDGSKLATVGKDQSLREWNVTTGDMTFAVDQRHNAEVWGLALTTKGMAVTGGWDRKVLQTDLAGHKLQGVGNTPRRYRGENAFPLSALAISPDGKLLAAGGDEKAVKLIDSATGSLVRLLEGHEDAVCGLAFSPDGSLLASAGQDGLVILWDPATGKLIRKLEGHANWVFCLAFSPDGALLASGGYDRSIRLWDVKKSEPLAVLSRHRGSVRALAFHPRGGILASAGADRSIRLWDLAKKEEAQQVKGHEDCVRALAYAPDGRLASASEDRKVKLWGPDGNQLRELALTTQEVTALSLAFTPRGRLLAIGDGASLLLADGTTLARISSMSRHLQPVSAVAISPDARSLYTAGRDQAIKAWSAGSERRLWESSFGSEGSKAWLHRYSPDGQWLAIAGEGRPLSVRPATVGASRPLAEEITAVQGAALSPDGKTFALACHDGTIVLADSEKGRVVRKIAAHKVRAWSVAWSPDGKHLLTAAGPWDRMDGAGEARVWSVETGKMTHGLKGLTARGQWAAWSRDGKRAVVCQSNGEALLYDTGTWEVLHTLKAETPDPARSASFSPDGSILAVGGIRGTIRLWDTGTGKEKASLKGPSTGVSSVAFSAHGSMLAATSLPLPGRLSAGEVWVYRKGKDGMFDEGKQLRGHRLPALCCAWSADGKRLATGGGMAQQGGEVLVWDVEAAKPALALGSHRHPAEAVAFTRDGSHLFSAGGINEAGEAILTRVTSSEGWSADPTRAREVRCGAWSPDGKKLYTADAAGAAQAWNAADGTLLAEWKGLHKGPIYALAVSPDGSKAATCGSDRRVRAWDTRTGEQLWETALKSEIPVDLAWSPDGKSLSVALFAPSKSAKGSVLILDPEGWKERARITWPDQGPRSLAFSPEGAHLAAGGMGEEPLAVFDARTWARVKAVKLPGPVRGLAWSRDGKLLAAGDASGLVRAWSVKGWEEVVEMPGHRGPVLHLSYGPDGRLASAGEDGTFRVWEKVGDLEEVTP
jgi:WD40 repeat protein/beta-lactamase regulating signal transducer with metallopeptidase domain